MRPCSEAKRLIGRPLESTLAERKSTTSYGEEPLEGILSILIHLFNLRQGTIKILC